MNSVTITVGELTPVQAGQIAAFIHTMNAENQTVGTAQKVETKTKATKKETAPAKVEEKVEEQIDLGFDPTPAAVTPPPAKKITIEEVIGKLQEFAAKNGRDGAAKMLGKYGLKSIRDLKEESYAQFIAELAK